jgi:hypothetical protein
MGRGWIEPHILNWRRFFMGKDDDINVRNEAAHALKKQGCGPYAE